ncbi:MAG: glycerol-3-phosphate acyltransferase [Actinobacteria bacterium]|jgi:glycerol-3-phosphate acyltransferase PlsY|nr:glycerol-3-phosphate acyltransferase [Acidimicrobiaceae bacterium]MBP6487536.1 glycerol-3-phosphate acyltransferase [Ilumatobacteraceae bacterium]NMD25415.1 glycerol-3-phosphate acyltransferase [Actinomycetota bacterium]MBK9972253.1 glycerol-3-phosphate acyltransferase [Acidimicrobiaceae bacterium]MBP7889093.1 glycerol-3-phosphate acyltransferase [Ilumatobacteraceae bacterium]
MRRTTVAGAAMLGYLIGTFPTADLVARRASGGRVDLRRSGSGNPGGANTLKLLGRRAGYTVMAGDIGKGAVASGVGALVGGPAGAHLAGSASVIGHCFPVWNGFRGGKGVAASVGQCLATFPAYFPIDVGVAALAMANPRVKQRALTATLASCAMWVLGGLVWWRKGWPNLWGPTPGSGLPLAAAVSSSVIVSRFLAAA